MNELMNECRSVYALPRPLPRNPPSLLAGYEDQGCHEMMRIYQTIHSDHEVCGQGRGAATADRVQPRRAM